MKLWIKVVDVLGGYRTQGDKQGMRQHIKEGKRYPYRIGIFAGVTALVLTAISPVLAAAVSQSGTTTFNATIGSVITISTAGPIAIAVTPTAGGAMSSAKDTVTVSTNNSIGYTLTLADTDTNTSLVSGANTIAAITGTPASPIVLTANKWGYRVDGVSGFGAGPTSAETNATASATKFAGVPSSASPFTLKTTAAPAASDVTSVWYGTNASSSQPSGTYTDNITYTATTN